MRTALDGLGDAFVWDFANGQGLLAVVPDGDGVRVFVAHRDSFAPAMDVDAQVVFMGVDTKAGPTADIVVDAPFANEWQRFELTATTKLKQGGSTGDVNVSVQAKDQGTLDRVKVSTGSGGTVFYHFGKGTKHAASTTSAKPQLL